MGGIGQFLLNQGASLLMFSHVGVQQRLAYTLWYWDDKSQVILLVQGINAVSRTHYDLVGALKRLFKTYTNTSPINIIQDITGTQVRTRDNTVIHTNELGLIYRGACWT